MKTFHLPLDWKTIDYPEKTHGSASINKLQYDEDLYLMEGVDGYELYEIEYPLTVTELLINGDTVMVDDPLHWLGMQRLAEACTGKVLVGGLGLGLILHHLAKNNKVTEIHVVEINQDVIDLISPLLPKDDRVTIHCSNILFHEWVHGEYDSIVLDIWVKHGDKVEVAGQGEGIGLLTGLMRFKFNNLDSKVYVWGSRDPEENPSVQPVSDEYIEMIREMREN